MVESIEGDIGVDIGYKLVENTVVNSDIGTRVVCMAHVSGDTPHIHSASIQTLLDEVLHTYVYVQKKIQEPQAEKWVHLG